MSSLIDHRQPWLAHGYPGIRSPTPTTSTPKQTWADDCEKCLSAEDSFPIRFRLQTQTSEDIYHLEHVGALLERMDADDETFLAQLVEREDREADRRRFRARPRPRVDKQVSSLIKDYMKKYRSEESKETTVSTPKTPVSTTFSRSSAKTMGSITDKAAPVFTDSSGRCYYKTSARPTTKMIVPHPSHRYPDRHARCFDLDHVHTPLITTHPSAGCNCFSPCAEAEYSTVGTLVASTPPYKMGRPRSAHMCGLHRCPTGPWPCEEVRQSDKNVAYGLFPRSSSPQSINESEGFHSLKTNLGSTQVPEFTSIVHRVEVHQRSVVEGLHYDDDKSLTRGTENGGEGETVKDQVGDGMLIIDPTSARVEFELKKSEREKGKKKKLGKVKGGKGKEGKESGGAGGKKKKGGKEEGLKKKKSEDSEDEGKAKRGKKNIGKEGGKKGKGKKSESGGEREGKVKGPRGPGCGDDSAVAAEDRRAKEDEERREREERDGEEDRRKRGRDGKGGELGEGDGEEDAKRRGYLNEDEAFEAEMQELKRKAALAKRGTSFDLLRAQVETEADEAERRKEMEAKATWMTSHMGLSNQSCRFELPMDMRLLEKMTPREYLSKYCVVSSKRMLLYKRVFGKFADGNESDLTGPQLAAALREVHIHGISEEQMRGILRLVRGKRIPTGPAVEEESGDHPAEIPGPKVDFDFFAGIAALTERLLFPLFRDSKVQSGNYAADQAEGVLDETCFGRKENLETADFFCMPWKFQGINVNSDVKRLLEVL